jgi:tetratricopeptide (TPR) repeat protein
LCRELGLYSEDRSRELLAAILHQKSFALTSPEEAISCVKRAIALIEKIRDPSEMSRPPGAWLGILNSSLCKYHLRNSNYREALKYASEAIKYHIASSDIRSEARTRLDLGIIRMAQKHRPEAIRELARSYQLFIKVGESPGRLLTILDDIGVDLPSLIKHGAMPDGNSTAVDRK